LLATFSRTGKLQVLVNLRMSGARSEKRRRKVIFVG